MGDFDCFYKYVNNIVSMYRVAESCIKSTVKIVKVIMFVFIDTFVEVL